MNLTENFDISEFDSKDGAIMPPDVLENVKKLAQALQVIRDFHDSPFVITSGYRSPEHNSLIDGAVPDSKHITGEAVDGYIVGVTPLALYNSIEKLIIDGKIPQGGLGLYSNRIHYDIRGTKARWNNTLLTTESNIVSTVGGAIQGTIIMFILGKIANLF